MVAKAAALVLFPALFIAKETDATSWMEALVGVAGNVAVHPDSGDHVAKPRKEVEHRVPKEWRQNVTGSTPTGAVELGTPAVAMSVIFDTGSDQFVAKTWTTIHNELKQMDGGVSEGDVVASKQIYDHNRSKTFVRQYVNRSGHLEPRSGYIAYGSGVAITDLGNDTLEVGGSALKHFPVSEISADSLAMLHRKEGAQGILGLQHMKNRSLGESAFSRLRDLGLMTAFGYCRDNSKDTGVLIWGDRATEGHEIPVVGQMHWAITMRDVKIASGNKNNQKVDGSSKERSGRDKKPASKEHKQGGIKGGHDKKSVNTEHNKGGIEEFKVGENEVKTDPEKEDQMEEDQENEDQKENDQNASSSHKKEDNADSKTDIKVDRKADSEKSSEEVVAKDSEKVIEKDSEKDSGKNDKKDAQRHDNKHGASEKNSDSKTDGKKGDEKDRTSDSEHDHKEAGKQSGNAGGVAAGKAASEADGMSDGTPQHEDDIEAARENVDADSKDEYGAISDEEWNEWLGLRPTMIGSLLQVDSSSDGGSNVASGAADGTHGASLIQVEEDTVSTGTAHPKRLVDIYSKAKYANNTGEMFFIDATARSSAKDKMGLTQEHVASKRHSNLQSKLRVRALERPDGSIADDHSEENKEDKSVVASQDRQEKSSQHKVAHDAGNHAPGLCATGTCAAIIDTGSNIIAGPTADIQALVHRMDVRTDCSNFEKLPDMTLSLGGMDITLPPSAYVMKVKLPPSAGRKSRSDREEDKASASMAAVGPGDRLGAWGPVFESLKSRGVDLEPSLGMGELQHLASLTELCMPALVSLDKQTPHGPLWVVGTPLFDQYYARWSFATNDDAPKMFIKPLDEAAACRKPKDERAAVASLGAKSRGGALIRTEARATASRSHTPSRHLSGPPTRHPDEIRYPYWTASLVHL